MNRAQTARQGSYSPLRFGAALAYYTAFSVVPLVVVVLEIATLIVGHNAETRLLKQIEESSVNKARKRSAISWTIGSARYQQGLRWVWQSRLYSLPQPAPLISFRML